MSSLSPGVGDVEVVGEEAQREGPASRAKFGEVPVADGVHDAQRHAVDVERGGLFEGPDDEGHEVGRHLHRRREADGPLAVAEVGVGGERGVGVRRQLAGDREVDLIGGLEGRLVPAGEAPPCVGVLELRGRDGLGTPAASVKVER